ncbi:hypothetical protein LZQ00_11795 [Sphingobacterium sp. SRCM116780]|uniref:hypothetical protein n=1 Tax=Sphingobacterium sp. SRCM116780 TaxID=2907623 RepID=UPI001F204D5A|nr:hypothetical protein [Sphingobacterium sp. SRCM116780]UIR54961.1 hypothetical protein LZQ00_11795 [Sphingobacterium sp. SRCM116780]
MKENSTYHEGMDANNLPNSLRVNPFGTPENYFNDLTSSLISKVKLESRKEEENFDIPTDYFASLQEKIFARIAEEKIKEQVQTDGFYVPEDYFPQLQNDTLTKVFEDKLKSQVDQDGFDVPSAYFADLNAQISSKISESNLKQLAALDGFEVPKDYFDGLASKITKSIQVESGTVVKKEVVIRSITKQRSWARYGAAASLAIVLGIGGYFGYQNSNAQKQQSNLAQVSDQEIINYLAQTGGGDDLFYVAKYMDSDDIEKVGTNGKIKDEDIEEYLKYTL